MTIHGDNDLVVYKNFIYNTNKELVIWKVELLDKSMTRLTKHYPKVPTKSRIRWTEHVNRFYRSVTESEVILYA